MVPRTPKYQDRLYINIQYKRQLYLGTECYHASRNARTVGILIFSTKHNYIYGDRVVVILISYAVTLDYFLERSCKLP